MRMTYSSSGAQDSLAVPSPQSEGAFACVKQALECKQSNIGLNLRFYWLLYFIHIWIGVRSTQDPNNHICVADYANDIKKRGRAY